MLYSFVKAATHSTISLDSKGISRTSLPFMGMGKLKVMLLIQMPWSGYYEKTRL